MNEENPYKVFELTIKTELANKMCITSGVEVPERVQRLFNKAIEIISTHVKPQNTNVMFCNGLLKIQFDSQRIAMHVPNFIAFDLIKLSRYKDEMIIAIILEEFAHCLIGITDEIEVKYYVASIYPSIKFNGEQYSIT